MAKTTGKKPSTGAKPARGAGTSTKQLKKPAPATKAVAKAPKRAALRAAARPPARPAVETKHAGKTTRSEPSAKPLAATKSRAKVAITTKAPVAAPAALPPANGKPQKNQAGLSSRELDHFRDLLLAKRRELIGDMSSMESEALRSSGGTNLSNLPIHMADMGTDNYEQEFTLGLVQKDRDLLKEINGALGKIRNGTYGLCEGTHLPINKERLEYQPWVRYSVEHQRKIERHGR